MSLIARSALFCSTIILFLSAALASPHTARHMIDEKLNKLKYKDLSVDGVQNVLILYSIPIARLSFLESSMMWNVQLNLLSRINPRYFIFVDSYNLV